MSYDLYFYKKKGADITERQISEYLTSNIYPTSKSDRHWFSENEDTETYFSFDLNDPEDDEEKFDDFDNTNFTFNLNFLRPDFFGQHAFHFVDKFVKELNLFVLNPQSAINADIPSSPQTGEFYQNWSEINAKNSAQYFIEYGLEYLPIDIANDFYNYNLNRIKMQDELGEGYFVPKLYLFKSKNNGKIITLCTWTEHIPNLFPTADYYLLTKKYKKVFRTVEESGLISAKTFFNRFGNVIQDFHFKGCKIIHPDKAEKIKELFNSTKIEFVLKDFVDKVPIEKIVNVKPK